MMVVICDERRIFMKRKITTILLVISLIIFNINGMIYAAEIGSMVYTENTSRGNIGAYQRISLYDSNVTVNVGNVEEGKILVVSAIPIYGGSSTVYDSEVTVPWDITKNTEFDLYIVVGGMSSLPLEVQFVAE